MKNTDKNRVKSQHFFKNFSGIFSDRILALAVLALIIIYYLSVVLIANNGILTAGVKLSDYELGKVAERDLIVDRDLEYVDSKATELKRQAEALLVEPVFTVSDSITERVMTTFDSMVNSYLSFYSQGKLPEEVFLEIQSELPGYLDEKTVADLYLIKEPDSFLNAIRSVLQQLMVTGITSIPDNFKNSTDSIEVLRWRDGEKEREIIFQDDAVTVRTIPKAVEMILIDTNFTELQTKTSVELVLRAIEENSFYDSELTEKNRARARDQVEPVIKKMVKGEVIVKKGFIITEENMIKVEALGSFSEKVNVTVFLGRFLYLLFLFIISVKLLQPPILLRTPIRNMLFLMLILFAVYSVTSSLVIRYLNLQEGMIFSAFVPTALVTMLISIMINTRVGIISSIILSLSILIMPGNQIYNFIFTFLSGAFGSLIVYGAENRITLVKAGLFVSLLNTSVIIIIGLLQSMEASWYLNAVLVSIVNGFLCGIFTLGLLPILEHMLNAPTPFRLMELSDLNTPLFKRMLILAPGTYSHSVSVANLAETAAKEIGANALLARVGAYYHDIGKIDQAEYFIENQKEGNKHDDLKATLSTAVIKSHVKIGFEKAKELGLPDAVMEIISQHHGSGQISYFYMKALKEQKMDQKLSPEDFAYNGTPPVSREAAVVMLADTVEAATRTLKNPTMAKLERFVWELIMEKVSHGQMKNTALTFKDLETVKNSFVQILGGSFHTRIEYPNQKEKSENE